MPSTGKINGDIIGVYINNVLIASSTDCNHNLSVDSRETTNKDDGGKYSGLPTKSTETIDGGFLVAYDSNNYQTLASLARNKSLFTWKLGSAVSGDPYYQGTGYFTKLSFSAKNNDNVTGNYSIQITGTVLTLTAP